MAQRMMVSDPVPTARPLLRPSPSPADPRQDHLLAAYTAANLAWVLGVTTLITAAPWLLATLSPQLVNDAFAPSFAALQAPSHPLLWILLIVQVPAMLACRRALIRGHTSAFARAHRVQSLAQLCWLQFLGWLTVPWFPTLGLGLVTTLMICWAANDALGRLALRGLRIQYALAFPIFDGMLLLLDAVGGPGLWTALAVDPGYVIHTIVFQVVLLTLTATVLAHVGRSVRAQDQWRREQDATARKLVVMETERAVIAQSSVLLGHGLAASQFSHDVASPVTVMRAASEELDLLLREAPSSTPAVRRALDCLDPVTRHHTQSLFSSWEASTRQVLRDLDEATSRTMRMTGSLARSLRSRSRLSPLGVDQLVNTAVDAMRTHLQGHGQEAPDVEILLERSPVLVTPGHAASVGNLLTNGALHAPGKRLEVFGEVLDPWYYRLVIRDHGVCRRERPAALRAIRDSLRLGNARQADGPDRAHRGYGIALMLAKVLVVKHHGWIAASPPDHGDGVALHLVLPRVEPALIPVSAGHPGRYLGGMAAHG